MKKLLPVLVLALICTATRAQNMNLKINEILPSNQAIQFDDFFEYDDWVEIYNPPGNPITNLAGYYISDDPDTLDKWQIPATDPSVTTILPNNFLILWVDDDFYNNTSQGADHNAWFTLSSEGETFLLTAPDGVTIIDSISYPETATDISYGRVCDGCDQWQYFNNVTFDDNNFEEQPNDLLFINEVQTQNVTAHDDPQYEFDQWFEIFNPNDHQVNVANYYLSVNGNPLQWQVPGTRPARTVIPAGGFLLIWCDNDVADDVNHAPFTLPVSGGTITITAPDGTTSVDTYTYGEIPVDLSYGRQSDGSSSSIIFSTPTPSVTNQLVIIQPQNLYINEILTANQNGLTDNVGELEDWIEIYNPNNFDVNIGGYYLTDDQEVRNKWLIPTTFSDSVTVPANGWLLFWADNDEEQGVLHTNFRLSNNGEYLGLTGPDGFTLADEIDWGYIAPDTSIGRLTDGNEQWILFIESTPEASNNEGTINVRESIQSELRAFPNPANENIYFSKTINLTVYSLQGQLVGSYNNVNQLELSQWAPGIYLLRDDSGNVLRIQKL
jgi:large repetitive protein